MEHSYAVIMAGGGGPAFGPFQEKKNQNNYFLCWEKKPCFRAPLLVLRNYFLRNEFLIVTVAEHATRCRCRCLRSPLKII